MSRHSLRFTLAIVSAFAAVYLIWGSTYLGIKVAVETLPWYLMAGARFALAGAVMLGALALGGALPAHALAPARLRRAALIGCLMLGLGNGLVVWAIGRGAPTGLTAVVIATTPFWLVLIERLLDPAKRIRPRTIVGLVVGFAGIAVLAGVGGSAPAGLDPLAVLGLIGATLAWAIGSIVSKRSDSGGAPLVATGLQMLLAGVAILAFSAVTERWSEVDLAAVSARSWIGFVYLVIFGSLIGYTAFIWLLRHVSAAAVGTYAYVNPVVAVALGAMLEGEALTTRAIVASALVLAAVITITLPAPRRRAPEAAIPTGTGPAPALRR